MDERINQALQNIENDLQNIKSAREQVEEVVSDSSKLQEKVAVYVTKVSEISKQLEETLSNISNERTQTIEEFNSSFIALKDSCDKYTASFGVKTKEIGSNFEKLSDEISSSFQTKSNTIISDFETKSQNATDVIKSEMSNLHDNIAKLNEIEKDLVSSIDVVKTLNDDIEKLMKELDDSQSAQDDDLLNIKNGITRLSDETSGINNKIESQEILLKSLEDNARNLKEDINYLSGKIISISQNIDNIKQSIQNYSDKIDYNTTALSNEIKNANKKTTEMFDGKFKTLLAIQIAIGVIIIVTMFIIK